MQPDPVKLHIAIKKARQKWSSRGGKNGSRAAKVKAGKLGMAVLMAKRLKQATGNGQ